MEGQYSPNIDNDYQFIEQVAHNDVAWTIINVGRYLIERKEVANKFMDAKDNPTKKAIMEHYKYLNEKINELLKTVKQ